MKIKKHIYNLNTLKIYVIVTIQRYCLFIVIITKTMIITYVCINYVFSTIMMVTKRCIYIVMMVVRLVVKWNGYGCSNWWLCCAERWKLWLFTYRCVVRSIQHWWEDPTLSTVLSAKSSSWTGNNSWNIWNLHTEIQMLPVLQVNSRYTFMSLMFRCVFFLIFNWYYHWCVVFCLFHYFNLFNVSIYLYFAINW